MNEANQDLVLQWYDYMCVGRPRCAEIFISKLSSEAQEMVSRHQDANGDTFLHILAHIPHTTDNIVKLINHGIDCSIQNQCGKTAIDILAPCLSSLYDALLFGPIDYDQALYRISQLDGSVIGLSIFGDNKESVMHAAARFHDPTIMCELLNKMPSGVTLPTNKFGDTPLRVAIQHGCESVQQVLYSYRRELYSRNSGAMAAESFVSSLRTSPQGSLQASPLDGEVSIFPDPINESMVQRGKNATRPPSPEEDADVVSR